MGHGTLVSTPDDRWYFVYHGFRKGFHTLGRQILMEPVEWTEDGWPKAPLGERRDQPMAAPIGVQQRPMIALSIVFKQAKLKATWGAWKAADMSLFETGMGVLKVRAKGDNFGKISPLTVMARDENYGLSVVATSRGDCAAGHGVFYNPDNWVAIEIADGEVRVREAKRGEVKTLATREWMSQSARFKIMDRANKLEFYVSDNGRDWQELTSGFDVSGYVDNELKGFQCARPALAASGDGSAGFSEFIYRAR